MLLQEFLAQHAQEKLAPKTVERYGDQAKYIHADLLAMPLVDLTPLHFNREWTRLLQSGGHTRKKEARPMSAKTVRNICGVISSAFSRGIKWGLTKTNPVTNSEPPRIRKHQGVALTPAQQAAVLESATSPWCLRTFLVVVAATGCRRGEVLALRWSDIVDGRATISRSMTQTRGVVGFKSTKTEQPRVVSLRDTEALPALEEHRKQQDEFRAQFGADYQADLDLIFANPNGSPLRPDSVSAAVSLLFRRQKLPKGASLHSLRHTHTSILIDRGVPLAAISARLGHSSIRTTQEIYAHMIHGQDDEAARAYAEYEKQHAAAEAPKKDHE
jgi:integrase